ncbi:MAG: O-methyltransferase [Treponema sp.]|nr:O-methyltransferase [Treponema sp.]
MEQISDIKTYARKEAIPIMMDETQQFICNYIKENNVQSVLEIGSAIGYSAIQFAKAAENVHVTTIEIDIDRYIKAVQNIKDSGLQDRITIFHADALTAQIEGQFDLIFIDAAKAQYIKFFEKYKENLSPNGVILSDNLSFHGMVEDLSLTHNYSTKKLVKKIRKYIDFLKSNSQYTTEFYQCGDGISVSRKNKEL